MNTNIKNKYGTEADNIICLCHCIIYQCLQFNIFPAFFFKHSSKYCCHFTSLNIAIRPKATFIITSCQYSCFVECIYFVSVFILDLYIWDSIIFNSINSLIVFFWQGIVEYIYKFLSPNYFSFSSFYRFSSIILFLTA